MFVQERLPNKINSSKRTKSKQTQMTDLGLLGFSKRAVFYFSVKRAFCVIWSEALPMRASNTPFSDFHELDVSS